MKTKILSEAGLALLRYRLTTKDNQVNDSNREAYPRAGTGRDYVCLMSPTRVSVDSTIDAPDPGI
jgi:hypothetical protein